MRNRNNRVWARLTDEEFDVIMRRIRKTGLSREAYIRSVLLGSVPREKPDERFYSIMRDLTGMANNAAQLARNAAAFGSIDARMIQGEAEKWSKFQVDVRREFFLPSKLE